MTPARLGQLTFPGSPQPWQALGLIHGSEPHLFDDVRVSFGDCGGPPFALTIEMAVVTSADALAGLPPGVRMSVAGESGGRVSRPTATAVDHVVILTDDLDRTGEALAAAFDAPRRRVREAGGGRRQGFHLLANTLLEVVEVPGHPVGSHGLWGVTLSVADLDALCATAGELVSPPKPAVQPGRRIATVRERAGLGVPVALMTPRLKV